MKRASTLKSFPVQHRVTLRAPRRRQPPSPRQRLPPRPLKPPRQHPHRTTLLHLPKLPSLLLISLGLVRPRQQHQRPQLPKRPKLPPVLPSRRRVRLVEAARKPPSLQLALRSPELLAPRVPVALQPSRVRLVPEHPVPAALAPETTPTHPARACPVPVAARVVAVETVPHVAHRANARHVPVVLREHARVGLVRSAVVHLPVAARVRTRE